MKDLASKPTYERVAYGIEKESQIIECLNNFYANEGYKLKPSSHVEDTKEKTDCWQETASGKFLRSAIKIRTTKNDILIALKDPFYGFNNEKTVTGRDVLIEYFQYITLSKDEKTIRVASGKLIHKISLNILEEARNVIGEKDLDLKKAPFSKRAEKILVSKIHPGCEVWYTRDPASWKPKLLGFIPPGTLKTGKEIKYHEFIR